MSIKENGGILVNEQNDTAHIICPPVGGAYVSAVISIALTPPEKCWFYTTIMDQKVFSKDTAWTLIDWLQDTDPLVRVEAYRVLIHRIGVEGFILGPPDTLNAAQVEAIEAASSKT